MPLSRGGAVPVTVKPPAATLSGAAPLGETPCVVELLTDVACEYEGGGGAGAAPPPPAVTRKFDDDVAGLGMPLVEETWNDIRFNRSKLYSNTNVKNG